MKEEQAKKIRIVSWIIFISYIIFLIYFLFFAESYGRTLLRKEYNYNLVLFKEIKRFFEHRATIGTFAVAANLIGNIVGFVPLGFILPILNKKLRSCMSITMISFEFSLIVEIVQLIFQVGSFDVDDLLLNTIGGIVGYFIFFICNTLRRKFYG